MQYAIYTPNYGDYGNPRLMAELAHEAEEAGWDGFFTWDHIMWDSPTNLPMADCWVMLAAMAMATTRIRLGPMVTPLPRRRPQKLARETVTLDHLSGGRLTLGVGLGVDWFKEYSAFGESANDRQHGAMLDEGLQVLCGLWSAQKFSYQGKHYQVKEMQFLPAPVQQPRIPVWVAAMWPNKKPILRAAQWDGIFPIGQIKPADLSQMVAMIRAERKSDSPFDVAYMGGTRDASDTGGPSAYAKAGATWWMESISGGRGSLAAMRERIRKGPPRH